MSLTAQGSSPTQPADPGDLLSSVPRPDLDSKDAEFNDALNKKFRFGPRFLDAFNENTSSGLTRLLDLFFDRILEQTGWTFEDDDDDPVARIISEVRDSSQREEFHKLVLGCIESRKFDPLRRLRIFQPLQQPSTGNLTADTPQERVLSKAVTTAWAFDYQGDYHRRLLMVIQAMHMDAQGDKKGPFSRQCPIVQGSATGKSRMVDKLAQLTFTIPFNLRHDRESKHMAFPNPDASVRDFLAKVRDSGGAMTASLLFLKCIFMEVEKAIKAWKRPRNSPLPDREAFAMKWWTYLAENRTALYSQAVANASKDFKQLWPVHAGMTGSTSTSIREFEQPTIAAFDSLVGTVQKAFKETDALGRRTPAVILYFDEVDSLFLSTNPKSEHGKNLSDFLCSAIDVLGDKSIFTLTLSTLSSTAQLAPAAEWSSSARMRDLSSVAILRPPISETPFDIFFSKNIPGYEVVKPGTMTHEDAINYFFLARFGRPLFQTLIKNLTPSLARSSFIDFVAAKLAADETPFQFENKSPSLASRMAILDVGLCINLTPERTKSRKIEYDMVASHMRMAYTIPEHRKYIYSGYPSEPILAEAASRLSWITLRNRPGTLVIDTLQEILSNEIIDRGQLGELVARELLTHAYQSAINKNRSKEDVSYDFSKGCSVKAFMEALFREPDPILESRPINIVDLASEDERIRPSTPRPPIFKDAFSDALIRFTHFVKATDKDMMTVEFIWMAYLRGMAIICPDNFQSVDLMIPIMLKGTNGKICKHTMSVLMVQVKRQVQAGSKNAYRIDEADLEKHGFFDHTAPRYHDATCGCDDDAASLMRPYVTLIMELGVPQDKHRVESSQGPVRGGKAELVHPCYETFAYGCSSSTYQVINSNQDAAYEQFLHLPSLESEIARKDSIDAVLKLKPHWARGDNAFHWAETALHQSR